jgi:hypothetical protein
MAALPPNPSNAGRCLEGGLGAWAAGPTPAGQVGYGTDRRRQPERRAATAKRRKLTCRGAVEGSHAACQRDVPVSAR